MKIFDPHITGSLSVSSSAEIQGDLIVSGTIYGSAQIQGQVDDAISASHAAAYLLTSSFENYTGSVATTGSNTFIGDQTISGSLLPQGTLTHDLGSDSQRWRDIYLAGSTINLGGTKITKDTNGNVEIKDGNNTLKKIVASEIEIGTSGNKKVLKVSNGKLKLSDKDDTKDDIAALSGSFTGSFVGDGARLTNIPASSVTGLNLARISNTTATASISNAGLITNVSIIPDTTDTVDLGSPTKQWRDLYLSSGSLYINGQQVLSTTGTELRVTTDNGESIKILEEGSDTITLQTVDGDITLTASGNGNIELDAPIQIAAGNKILSSDGNSVVFGNGLIITGSIELSGNVDGVDVADLRSDVDAILAGSSADKDSFAEIVTLINSVDTSNDQAFAAHYTASNNRLDSLETISSSHDGRLDALETKSGSVDTLNTTQNSRLTSLETKTGSLDGDISTLDGRVDSLETKTGSLDSKNTTQDGRLSSLETKTGSLDSKNTTQDGRLTSIESFTSSIDDTYATDTDVTSLRNTLNTYTSSNDSTNTTQNSRIGSLETKTGSLDSDISTLDGRVDSLESVSSSHNERLNEIEFTTGSQSGRLTSLETFTGSIDNTYATDTDVTNLRNTLNTYTSSNDTTTNIQDLRLSSIETKTGSLEGVNTTQDGRLSSLETFTGSIDDTYATDTDVTNLRNTLNTYTSSNDTTNTTQNSRIGSLETKTGSLDGDISTLDGRVDAIEVKTGSLENTNTTQNSRLSSLETKTGSLDTVNSNQDGRLDSLEEFTSSIDDTYATDTDVTNLRNTLNTYTSSNDSDISSIQTTNTNQNNRLSSLETTSGSHDGRLDSLETKTGSLDGDISTLDGRLDSIETETGSLSSRITTEKNRVDAILNSSEADKDSFAEIVQLINSVDTSNDQAFAAHYTASNNRLDSLETKSGSLESSVGSLETFTGSINSTIKTKLNTENVVSGSEFVLNETSPIIQYVDVEVTASNGKYYIDGVEQQILSLSRGLIYRFDVSSTSLSGHPFRFSTDEANSNQYTTNVTVNGTEANSGAYVQIVVDHSTPQTLYYYCTNHSGMGNKAFIGGAGDTDSVSEGSSNLYYTDARVKSKLNTENVISGSQQVVIGDTTGYSGLDERIGGIETKTGSFENTISTQNGRIGSLEVKTGSLDNDISTLDGRVDSLEIQTGSLDGRIDSLESTSGSHKSRLDSLESNSGSYLTSHPNISAANSSNNSGRTYIQDLLLDSNGHVTGLTTGTETVVNTDEFVTGASWNNSNAVLTFTRNDGDSFNVTLLDTLSDVTVTGGTYNSGTQTLTLTKNDGNTVSVSGFAIDTDVNYYLTGATFNNGDGVLTLKVKGSSDVTVDLDGRYLESETDPIFTASPSAGITNTNISNWNTAYAWGDHSLEGYLTSHPSITAASSSDNSGRTYIQDILLDGNGHVTGITTSTETVVNTDEYTTGATFNSGNGIITFTRNDGDTYTVDIDGRFLRTQTDVHGELYNTGGDADDYTAFGIYRNYASNGPIGGHNTILNVMQSDGNYGFQIGSDTNASSDGLYFRSKGAANSLSGTTWYQVATRTWVGNQNYLTQHPSITAASSSNNGGRTYIQDILLDSNGHVTGITTATETVTNTDTNHYTTGATFNTGNGIISFTDNKGDTYTVDIDGRFLTSFTETDPIFTAHVAYNITSTNISNWNTAYAWGDHSTAGYLTSHPSISAASSSDNSGRTYIQDILLDGNGHVTGITTATETVTNTDTNYYVDGLSFDTATGILTASVNGTTNQTVDLDGRYLTSHPSISAASTSNNSGQTFIQDITLDAYGHITGIGTAVATDYFTTGSTFNSVSGIITFTRNDGNTYTVDISDTLSEITVTGGTYDDQTQTLTLTKSDGNTVDVTGFALDTDVNYYLTGATFNTGDGVITLAVKGSSNVTVDIDGRYLPLAGGTVTGNIDFNDSGEGIVWSMNTDGAGIKFYNTGDSDTNSRLEYYTSDNGNEYHSWLISSVQEMTLKSDGLRVTNDVRASGEVYSNNGNSTQWDTAYGWGDHSTAGYLTSHPSITAASSSDNSGRTYIQDILLDGNGHVTGITTATETVTNTDTNYYVDGLSFDTGNGVLTASVNGTTNQTVDLDGRYLLDTTDTFTGALTIIGDIRGNGQQLVLNAGESYAYATGQTGEYVYINAEQGLEVNSETNNWTVNGWSDRKTALLRGDLLRLDGENLTKTNIQNFKTAYQWGDHSLEGYLTGHPSISAASSSNNSGRTYIQDILLDGNGHVTGITTATETVINTDTNDIDYINSASFNTSNGVLTLSGVGNAGATVDLDGRYLQSYTETDTLSDVIGRGNTTTSFISFTGNGTDTGIRFNNATVSNDAAGIRQNGTSNAGELEFFTTDDDDEPFVFRHYTTGQDGSGSSAEWFRIGASGNVTAQGTVTATGGNSTQWNTAYTYSQVGHLPLAGGTMSGGINMNNNNLTNVNHIQIGDPGAGEGIEWSGGNGFKIYESPNNLTNASGNLQFVVGSTRILTLGSNGQSEFTDKLTLTSSTSGSTIFDIQGTSGQLFSITDDLTGDLFAVSDASGVPIFNVNASGAITMDTLSSLYVGNNKVINGSGNIEFDGPVTTTNQGRGIYWTGYDKEGTTDFSDTAHILHTTNSGGLSGSVIEIKSHNDTTDGVNFVVNGNSAVRINGNIVVHAGNYTSYQQHPTISAASSSDNSGRTYIQDITLDSNGHVTGIQTATETVTNTDTNDIDYINSASFNTSDGVLTLSGVGNAGATVDLDGRYAYSSHDHNRITENATITFGASQLQWMDQSGTGGTGLNGAAPQNPNSDWHHQIIMNHANGNGYYVQMAFDFHDDQVWFQRMENGTLEGWREFIHSGNIGSQSVSYAATAGSASSATNANYATTAGSADQIDGVAFRNTNSGGGINADSLNSAGTTYYTGGVTNFSGNASDGALYSQVYSSSWQHQIAGDYRSGRIAVRGKNNNTWQSWRKVPTINSTTFSSVTSVSFTHDLGTDNCIVQLYDSNGDLFFPSSIRVASGVVTVTFEVARSGRLVVTG